ncbi:MAG: hypothetical protein IKK01_05770 [Clostridia bacterium]|nr:hypothetical protein [Clostridia bacterium]
MENVKSENRIFEGFKPRIPLVLIFALGVLLGSLTPIFGEVPVFSGAALFVIASLVFMTAREILPVVGILCPALFAFMMTGELAAPALYIGVIFTVGATVYLTLGGRVWAPIACAAVAYALGAVAIDPISALPALIPVAVGLFAALMLPRQGLTFATAALTSIALTAGLSFFLASGGDLAAVADTVRESIANAYASLNSEFLIITEDTAKTLAAYIINISPGFIFAAASAVVFVSLSLANTLFRASGVGDKIPEEMAKLTLSPISGIIYLFCFFLSAAFMIEGTDYELHATVTENIIIALSLPFTALGFRGANEYLAKKFASRLYVMPKALRLLPVVIFLLSPSVGFALFISVGIAYSMRPVYRFLFSKMRSKINK